MEQIHSQSRSGRWFLAAVGLFIALIGGLFVWLLASSYLRAKEMRQWPEIPCTILVSSVEERQEISYSAPEFRHQILFGYEYDSNRRTSSLKTLRGSKWSSQRAKALARTEEWPVGSRKTCWVCPWDPDTAVLKPDSLAPGYTLWFPMLFVVGGLVIFWRALRTS